MAVQPSQGSHTPGAFERLIDADRSGVLPYTRHLTLGPKVHDCHIPFNPSDLQEYLPHLRLITELRTLTLDSFGVCPSLSRFSTNISACSPTLYDTSTYEEPIARNSSSCISYASFLDWKT